MNSDKNDVALDQAPASVDGKDVLKVLQISISDIAAEDGYKVLLDDATTAAVPLADFTAGAVVTTTEKTPAEQQVAPEVPQAAPAPAPVPEAPAAPQDQPVNNGVTL